MKRHYLLTLFSIFVSFYTNAQKSAQEIDKVLQEITKESNLLKRIEEIENIFNISQKIGYTDGMIISGRLLMLNASRMSDYENVIKTGDKIKNLKPVTNKNLNAPFSDIFRMNGLAKSYLGFSDIAFQEFKKALEYGNKIESYNSRHYKLSLIYENITICYENEIKKEDSIRYYLEKSIEKSKMIKDDGIDISVNHKYDAIANTYNLLGDFYMKDGKHKNIKKAGEYYKLCVNLHEKYETLLTNKIFSLLSLGEYYHKVGKYKDATETLEKSLQLEKGASNPLNRLLAFRILTKSYIELNQPEKSKKFLDDYTTLRDSIEYTKKKSINKIIDTISLKEHEKHKTSLNNILITSTIFFLICGLIIFISWKRHNKKLHNNYKKLMKKIKQENKFDKNNLLDNTIISEGENIKNNIFSINKKSNLYSGNFQNNTTNIVNETVNSILKKLEKFEKQKKYIKKDVNLASLATYLGTNTKYLSEIIKLHKGKSYSSYINGLRIDYIVSLLYEEPKYREYKISYLGELCGFASREVFSIVFKKETGITPFYFIENLKKKI